MDDHGTGGGDTGSRRLFVYNGGFLTQGRVRRILELSGYDIRLGAPAADSDDMVGVWGRSPTAPRGEAVAARRDAPILRVEDAFLRSVHTGREGDPPLGLILDDTGGVHFDASAPSKVETLLAEHPLDDTALLNRARGGMARLKEARLSKYNAHDIALAPPDPGYVLVIDQTRGDASIEHGGADANSFREMLYWAQDDHPAARIYIKTHPETQAGKRDGYFNANDTQGRISLLTDPVCPHALLEGAVAVYTVTSQLGYEAVLAGHRTVTFGTPFYAGWGLTDDRRPVPRRRGRNLTRAQMFAVTHILAPTYFDPCRNRLASFEEALSQLEAEVRAFREDRAGWVASNMRLWKRAHVQSFFGGQRSLRFRRLPADAVALAKNTGARHMTWGSLDAPQGTVRVEDGFLRSRGLGADLVPPLSLTLDTCGLHYDPSGPSDLEALIARRADLRPDQRDRAEALIARLVKGGLSKYNLGGAADLGALLEGRRILVPGQVEDDASIILGAGDVRRNADLLKAAREANTDAVILYKPHPDVEAGLRPGALTADEETLADVVLRGADPAALLCAVDGVWTMTSGLGFEALLRGVPVTVLGAPFYAGWGLTEDLGPPLPRRTASPTLAGLVHAALIDYPRYRDPISGRPCPVEVAVDRIAEGQGPRRGVGLRLLAKLQGALASRADLWR